MVDDYFDLLKKLENTKKDFKILSEKFKELKSLAINYKDEKELEIQKLGDQMNEFKSEVEKSRNLYEETLDKTTKSIEKFIKNAENGIEKDI